MRSQVVTYDLVVRAPTHLRAWGHANEWVIQTHASRELLVHMGQQYRKANTFGPAEIAVRDHHQ